MRNISPCQINRWFFITFALTAVAIWSTFYAPTSMAQSPAQNGAQGIAEDVDAASSPISDRKLIDGLPRHLPIKVKVKNLHKEKWARELEVEVTNKSDKPIYYLDMGLVMPELTETGAPLFFPLRYGRGDLISFTEPLQPDDVPIRPGEKYTFKISTPEVVAFEQTEAEGKRARPKRLVFEFQLINFGDGTGFATTGGVPMLVKMPRASLIIFEASA